MYDSVVFIFPGSSIPCTLVSPMPIRRKLRGSYALRYYRRRQGSRLNRPAVILALHALASLARIFTPYMPLHRELRRLYGQFLRYLVAYMLKLASAGAYLFIVGDVVNNIHVR